MPLPPAPFVYAILDIGLLGGRPAGPVVGALVEGGVRLLQVRGKQVPERDLLACCEAALDAARPRGVPVLVNDRPDVARIVGADGVHVGQGDLPVADVRSVLGDAALVGLSTHDPNQLATALGDPIDYVAVGPVYPTPTKADADPVVGLALVAEARRLSHVPVVAIGGITSANAGDVVRAGAHGLAVASALLGGGDVTAAVRRLAAAAGAS